MNDILNQFRDIANTYYNNPALLRGEDTAIVGNLDGTLAASGKDDTVKRHLIGKSDATKASMAENDRARTLFYNAIVDLFSPRRAEMHNGQMTASVGQTAIPKSVLDALEMDNFKLNNQHQSTTGKPLTARRIMRVLDAISHVTADVSTLGAKTDALRTELTGLGQTAESFAPNSNERVVLLNDVRLSINKELMNFRDEATKKIDSAPLPEADKDKLRERLWTYHTDTRNAIDDYIQAAMHDSKVKVGEWSKALIERSIREIFAQKRVPSKIVQLCGRRPFENPLPLTSIERGLHPSALKAAFDEFSELVSNMNNVGPAYRHHGKEFFAARAGEFRAFLDTLPGANNLDQEKMTDLLNRAMYMFTLFVGDDHVVSKCDSPLMARFFTTRGDLAAGLFKDALTQAFNDPSVHNALEGETANRIRGEKFVGVLKENPPPVEVPREEPVANVNAPVAEPEPEPVKTHDETYAPLFEKTGEYSLEQTVRDRIKGSHMEPDMAQALVDTAKNFATRYFDNLKKAIPEPLTKELQANLEHIAKTLCNNVHTAMMDFMMKTYFAQLKAKGVAVSVDAAKDDFEMRLSALTQQESSTYNSVNALSKTLKSAINEGFADLLAQRLAARKRNLSLTPKQLCPIILDALKGNVELQAITFKTKYQGLPKRIVDTLEKQKIAEVEARIVSTVDRLANEIAEHGEGWNAENLRTYVAGAAISAWNESAKA